MIGILGILTCSAGAINIAVGISLMGDRNIRAMVHLVMGLGMIAIGSLALESALKG